MKDFFVFYEHLKSLYDDELYEDVKQLADLLNGVIETKGNLYEPKDKYMIYYYHGNAAFHLKEYRLAENLFNKALQMNKSNLRPKPKPISTPDCETDVTIKYNLHLCYMQEKRYQEAFSILDSIPVKQRSPKILLSLGKLCQLLLYTKEAINTYKEILKISKLSLVAIEALNSLGVKFDDLPKLPATMNVEWFNVYLKAKNHLYSREYKDAIETFKCLDSQFSQKSCEIMSSLGNCQFLNGEYSNACATFERLHRIEPAYTSKMDIYAYLLYSDKSDRDKINALEKCIGLIVLYTLEAYRKSWHLKLRCGFVLRLSNDMHSVSLNIPETWTAIGYYCLKKKASAKIISENIKCFVDNALAIDSQNAEALLLKAIAYSKYKSINETASVYREVTRVNPHFFEAYKGLVDSLLNLSHTKDAIQVAGSAIKLIGSNPRTLTLYGDALSRDSSTQEKSKTYLYKAIKGDPDNQEAVICLVKVCMSLQHFDEALDVLGKFIRHNSSNHRLLHIYIELMKKFKRTDEALLYLNKIAGMDPNNVEIRKILEKAEQNMETNQDETMQNISAM